MPTITTTTTSSDAYGTSTVTSTQSTPDPVVAQPILAPPESHDGAIITVQTYKFASTTDRDSFVSGLNSMLIHLNLKKDNAIRSYIYETDALGFELVSTFPSPADFEAASSAYEKFTVLTSLMGTPGFSVRGVWGGNTAPIKATLDEWNKVPCMELLIGSADSLFFTDGKAHDNFSFGAVGVVDAGTPELMDAFVEEMTKIKFIFNHREATWAMIRISPSAAQMVFMHRSKEDGIAYVTKDDASDILAPMREIRNQIKSFGGHLIGNHSDPDVVAALGGWPTFFPAKALGGVWGGEQYIYIAKANFDTTALRDEALANTVKVNWAAGASTFASFPVGQTSSLSIHVAGDTASQKACQASYAGDADLIAGLEKMDHIQGYLAGNRQAGMTGDMAGWSAAANLSIIDAKIMWTKTNGCTVTDKSLFALGEVTYKTPEDMAALYDGFADHALNVDTKTIAAHWRLTGSKVMSFETFESCEDWFKTDDYRNKMDPEIWSHIKSATYYISGHITPEARKRIDGWTAAPWCNIVYTQLSGKVAWN